jgi:hypothetical protein
MRKRRHHYVWQHYLKAWTTDGTLACLRDNGVFRTTTSNVAVEKDFYRVGEVSDRELVVIRGLIARSPPQSHTVHAQLLEHVVLLNKLDAQSKSSQARDPRLAEAIEEARSNLEEDLHTGIEGRALPLLDALREDDASFFSEREDFANFVHFLCAQAFRTKSLASTLTNLLEQDGLELSPTAWGVLRHVFSMNVAGVYVGNRASTRLTLISATGAAEFLTSDQPVINLHGSGTSARDRKPPDKLQFFYPISPKRAVLLSLKHYDDPPASLDANDDRVRELNQAIVSRASEQVYARDEGLLRELSKPGDRSE